MAMIGRNAAVADFGKLKLRGRLAWWFWGLVHIYFLINARSASLVMTQWAWAYLTRKKGARLITGLRPLFAAQPVENRDLRKIPGSTETPAASSQPPASSKDRKADPSGS